MTSCMSTQPSSEKSCRVGIRDPEPARAPAALIEDEVPVLTQVRRDSDATARKVAGDATPEAITDDEPTVRINLRRAGLRPALPRPPR